MKPKLAYIFPALSTFVRKDADILRNNYDVVMRQFAPPAKILLPLFLLRDFLTLPFLLMQAEKVVCQFGGYHTVLPVFWSRLLRKPCAIVLGGYDAVALPEIGYGAFANKWMRRAVIYSYRRASLLLPVHRSLMMSESVYGGVSRKQGVLHFIPALKTKTKEIPNGYDPAVWPLEKETSREFMAVTVASGLEEERRKILKGIDLFLEVAEKLPGHRFMVIGGKPAHCPANVICLEEVRNEELPGYYNNARLYMQLSLSEGFPNAMCEAMLCGCMPVVSAVASMPEIAGDTGFVLPAKNAADLVQWIQSLPNDHSVTGSFSARKRIEENYTLERRRKELLEAIGAM